PAVNLFTIVAETAGADGLKIAETFPEGRGSLQARQAQRRRAMTAGTEPLLCRVAAAPYPAYVRTTCR
ncbi:hypothetical protein, partial [Klebsiella pneumoniae]|uniref:hypothetical protein n=1 Tax=Klebsiella pneumoniae TaxID=573 RepID=UPI001D0DDA0F